MRHIALLIALAALLLPVRGSYAEQDASELFARYKNRIFQVRLIDLEADEKASLGTGFLVARKGLLVTNFHVISEQIDQPEKYRLEYLSEDGRRGDLEVLDVDVVNDLALLQASDLEASPLFLAESPPIQGDTIYSLGNPYDIGFTVIPGTYNGYEEGSYHKRIHFSGSVNAGMSGGPVLDHDGGVVGVNVSTAGNQVSFLVPAEALEELIADAERLSTPVTDFRERIRGQLEHNQREMIRAMLAEEWPSQPLGQAEVVGEMLPFVKCWGGSSDDKKLYKYVSSSCQSEQPIFLNHFFSTGIISYQFFWLEADQLTAPRFLNFYQSFFSGFVPDNLAGEDDVGNYRCDEFFVEDSRGHADKVVLCVRAYREYAGLYDALYLRGSVDESEQGFISHFTLAGVERETLADFMNRFQSVVQR